MGTEKKKTSLGDRISYFYIKNIKKWMFCPACKNGRMTFNKKKLQWTCEECGYHFSEEYFLDDCVFWFCDECETYLNNQEGFDSHENRHICRNCGYENDTTFENIKGTCSDCGKNLPDPDATLCADCREARRQKAKEWLVKAGKVVGVVAAVVGAVALAASAAGDDDTTDYTSLPDGDDEGGQFMKKDFVCRGCGHTWSMTEDEDGLFDGYGVPPCPLCGDAGCDPNDYADYTCEYCGHKWRQYGNGGLVLGCIPRCPQCHC